MAFQLFYCTRNPSQLSFTICFLILTLLQALLRMLRGSSKVVVPQCLLHRTWTSIFIYQVGQIYSPVFVHHWFLRRRLYHYESSSCLQNLAASPAQTSKCCSSQGSDETPPSGQQFLLTSASIPESLGLKLFLILILSEKLWKCRNFVFVYFHFFALKGLCYFG